MGNIFRVQTDTQIPMDIHVNYLACRFDCNQKRAKTRNTFAMLQNLEKQTWIIGTILFNTC